jgi:hypothetical protein
MTSRTRQFFSLTWPGLCLLCLLGYAPLLHAEEGQYDEQEEEYYCPEDYPIIDVQPETSPDIKVETKKAVEDLVGKSAFDFLDPQYDYVSDYLRRFTTTVDQFMANAEKAAESTGSYIRLTLDTTWTEGGNTDFSPGLQFKLRLPQTKKKLSLTIESDPEEKRTTQDIATNTTEQTNNQKNSGVYTGLEKDVSAGTNWKVQPGIGVRIRSPLDFYVRVRAAYEKSYGLWQFSFKESIYWFDVEGYGEDSSIGWDRLLSKDLIFRSSSFLRYTEVNKYFDMSQSFFLIHQITQNRTISYQVAAFADSKPALYATGYLINARYRQNVHKDFVFVEVSPQINYQKENNFDSEFSLFVRLELYYRG